ncbi:MAG: hypothetical protein E7680_02755 [Ruminococcaceae bacterium]|nr:hypothetical protein [Oscillospiraceae bacterium]
MAIQQLTVFLENKQGKLAEITRLLAKNGIDLRALSIADTAEFGILRLIVSNTEKAKQILAADGTLVQITEVVGVRLSDRPGELADVLSALDEKQINVEYLYAFLTRSENSAYVVLRVADNAAAEETLKKSGFRLVGAEDIVS